jgi:hypothetical protein
MTEHLIIAAGEWWTLDGRAPDEPLVLQQIGPPLRASRPGCITLTGWRHIHAEPAPVRVAVQIREQDAAPPADRT